ncbi:Hypothetical predicted protein [Paramuricea clavata]|uniref:Uncharacterized protein n=1 Tax=Paramuricea clavata TaxID=317549 RepID=A0A7D9JTC2_PARCT|nr:Hypothetical predicted protein [Paramuricea clavata]
MAKKPRKFWWRRFHLSRREKRREISAYRGIKYGYGYRSKISVPCINLCDIAQAYRVIVGAMDDEWEADLVIMDSFSQQNNVIDVLSKYAWVEAIKAKTEVNLATVILPKPLRK